MTDPVTQWREATTVNPPNFPHLGKPSTTTMRICTETVKTESNFFRKQSTKTAKWCFTITALKRLIQVRTEVFPERVRLNPAAPIMRTIFPNWQLQNSVNWGWKLQMEDSVPSTMCHPMNSVSKQVILKDFSKFSWTTDADWIQFGIWLESG